MPVQLVSPSDGALISARDTAARVGLSWKGQEPNGAQLWLSHEGPRQIAPGAKELTLSSVPPGTYQWRITDSAGTPQSLTWSFLVEASRPPELYRPTAGELLYLGDGPRARLLSMLWSAVERATAYEVTIATDHALTQVVAQHRVRRPQWVLEQPLAPGRYFWRVRCLRDSAGEDLVSTVESFEIVEQPPLPPPEMGESSLQFRRGEP